MCSKIGAIYQKARGETVQVEQSIDRDVATDSSPLAVERRGKKAERMEERRHMPKFHVATSSSRLDNVQ